MLKKVAAEISAIAENSDLVARRGGDGFAVLVSNGTGRDLDAMLMKDARAEAARASLRLA